MPPSPSLVVGSFVRSFVVVAHKDDQPTLFEAFVEGSPSHMTGTINATRGLVNGTMCLEDHLAFADGVPLEVGEAFAAGRFAVVTLDAPPEAVWVRVGSTKADPYYWHGVLLPDLHQYLGLGPDDPQLVPILLSAKSDEVVLHGMAAAQYNVRNIQVKSFGCMQGFTFTDYKLQGRTLIRLILNVCQRHQAPYYSLDGLYVLLSRVRGWAGLRLLFVDDDALEDLKLLTWPDELYAWHHGYDADGKWSDALAAAAYASCAPRRAQIEKRRAASKSARDKRKRQAAAVERARKRGAAVGSGTSRTAAVAPAVVCGGTRSRSHGPSACPLEPPSGAAPRAVAVVGRSGLVASVAGASFSQPRARLL